MAAFPTVKFDWRDLSEDLEPVVERNEMERGIPKQRRTNSDQRVVLQMTLHFDTQAEHSSFMSFFNTSINAGQDFFDFTEPVGSAAVQGRIVGGKLGPRMFKQPTLGYCSRTVQIEYWVSAW